MPTEPSLSRRARAPSAPRWPRTSARRVRAGAIFPARHAMAQVSQAMRARAAITGKPSARRVGAWGPENTNSSMIGGVPRADDILALAQFGDRAAIEEVFRDIHPSLHRISRELVGEEARADQIVNAVLRNALRALPQWSSWGDPETWFYHQAVQAARRVRHGRPEGSDDLLVTALPAEQR